MIVEGAILLLVAQLVGGFAPLPSHAVPEVYPSIDEAAAALSIHSEMAPSVFAGHDANNVVTASESSRLDPVLAPSLFEDAVYRSDAALEVAEMPPQIVQGVNEETQLSRRRLARRWLGRRASNDYGLAYDRVMFAPIYTPTALGVPNAGLQFRFNRGAARPDRLEYLWARAGKGPAAETRLDLLDSVFRTELGSARAVLISEISMRSLDPELAPNTTGFGDMVVGGKTVIMDGTCTKLSSIFLTYINTGPADKGLGTGHVSLEPGLLGMHQWSERTFLHGAIQYRVPIAGARGFAGDVLATSWAASTIWQDCDSYAWMPVLELQTHSFLFGAQTEPDGTTRRVDGTTAFDILPGSRFAWAKSALGACELGVSGGWRCSDADWFDSRMMVDIRWLR